ncbi:hypothetical protein Tco_0391324, partial [Tanacetum coccineum]
LSRWGMQLAEIECTGRGMVDSMRRYAFNAQGKGKRVHEVFD